jgi:HYR domain-containing protein
MRNRHTTLSLRGSATRLIGMLGLAFALTPSGALAQCKQPVYVIAHRCNSPTWPHDAVTDDGVNAIEADFKWGRPTVGADDRWTVEHDPLVTIFSTQLDDWLDEVAKETTNPQSGLALIVLDIKTPDGPIVDLYHRVRNKLGPDINLMFSVGSFDGGTANLGKLRDLLNADPRAGAAIDFLTGEETQDKVEAFFKGINMNKYWFADGLFAGGVVSVEKNVADGMALRDAETNCSAFHGVYTWTYEEEDAIQSYLNKGVNGIIVNTNACFGFANPGGPEVIDSAAVVVSMAKQTGRKFATKADNPFDMRPQITCPSNVTVECSAAGGAQATDQSLLDFQGAATCSSGYCSGVSLSNNAPSFYPLGPTPVTFTATTAQVGSCTPTSSCTASVTVKDTTAPSLSCPADLVLDPISLSGNPVAYQTPVTDICDPQVAVVCSNPPGSTFAVGTTTPVTCTATDHSTNATTCSFNVKILTPQEVVGNLKAGVTLLGGQLNQGQISGLLSQLDALLASITSQNSGSICGQLDGFIAKVGNYLSQGKLAPASAQPLITSANNLKQTYNCF